MRRPVPVQFDVDAVAGTGFAPGAWNEQYPLVIDPALSFVSGMPARLRGENPA